MSHGGEPDLSSIDAETARSVAETMQALATPSRLLMLTRLRQAPCSVGELAALLDLRDSTVSQHLALLRKDGLVTARRDGQTIWYSLGSLQARELVRTLYRIYCTPGAAAKAKARRRQTPAAQQRLAPNQ